MFRKSRARVKRASSAIAPAISMPLGSSLTITNVSRAAVLPHSCRLRLVRNQGSALSDLSGVDYVFQSRRMHGPFVVTKIGMVRAGCETEYDRNEGETIRPDLLLLRSIPSTFRAQPRMFGVLKMLRTGPRRQSPRRLSGGADLTEQREKVVAGRSIMVMSTGPAGEAWRRQKIAKPARTITTRARRARFSDISPALPRNSVFWPRFAD